MKKIVRLIILLLVTVSIPSFSYAINKNDVPNGSYIIGTYMFNKNKTANYDGTLTTPMIMLAAKSINSNDLADMIIYYKNSRGKWVNAINNKEIASVPTTFEITCTNLDCQPNFPPILEGSDEYSDNQIGNGTYIIGKYLFDKTKNSNYDGTLTTPMIMLASKTLSSNSLSNMIIYYKNSRGKWVNAINNKAITDIPSNFYITYVDLVKQILATKLDDLIIVDKESFDYDGDEKEVSIRTTSGLIPTVKYYNDDTCTTEVTTIKDAGTYYVSAQTTGNTIFNEAYLSCSEAITINKIDPMCPTIFDYTGSYDKAAHSITVTGGSGGTIQYQTDGEWSSIKPTQTDAGETSVSVRILGDINHNDLACGSKKININKISDQVSVLKGTFKYDGTVKHPTVNVVSGQELHTTYYTDSTCSTQTTTANALEDGGAPFAIGTYYLIAYTDGNNNYNPFSVACREAITITDEKTDDQIYIFTHEANYTGNPFGTFFGSNSGLDTYVTYYTDATCSIKTNAINGASSEGGEPTNVGTYYVTAYTEGNENYNPATQECVEGLIISKREISVTAPTVVNDTLTYTGNAQVITDKAGSCSLNGTMYYYTKEYTSATAPEFAKDSNDWSTTYPTVSGTDAGMYYLWFICYVEDIVNNTGENINTVMNVTKEINA